MYIIITYINPIKKEIQKGDNTQNHDHVITSVNLSAMNTANTASLTVLTSSVKVNLSFIFKILPLSV